MIRVVLILAIYVALSLALAFRLRHKAKWLQRLNDFHWQCWVMLDIAAAFPIFWLAYILHLIDDRPATGATISAFVGWRASKGRRWAIALAKVIDLPFLILLSQKDHCAKEYAKWANPLGSEEATA